MPESRRFDPAGWFMSTCFFVLAGAVALHLAVSLIRSVWTWLVLGLGAVVLATAVIRLVLWWHRRQLW